MWGIYRLLYCFILLQRYIKNAQVETQRVKEIPLLPAVCVFIFFF